MPEVSKEEVEKFVMLMLKILTHPDLNAEYIINPRGVLDQPTYGISDSVKEVVLSGDSTRIQKMFREAGFLDEGRQMVNVP